MVEGPPTQEWACRTCAHGNAGFTSTCGGCGRRRTIVFGMAHGGHRPVTAADLQDLRFDDALASGDSDGSSSTSDSCGSSDEDTPRSAPPSRPRVHSVDDAADDAAAPKRSARRASRGRTDSLGDVASDQTQPSAARLNGTMVKEGTTPDTAKCMAVSFKLRDTLPKLLDSGSIRTYVIDLLNSGSVCWRGLVLRVQAGSTPLPFVHPEREAALPELPPGAATSIQTTFEVPSKASVIRRVYQCVTATGTLVGEPIQAVFVAVPSTMKCETVPPHLIRQMDMAAPTAVSEPVSVMSEAPSVQPPGDSSTAPGSTDDVVPTRVVRAPRTRRRPRARRASTNA